MVMESGSEMVESLYDLLGDVISSALAMKCFSGVVEVIEFQS